MKKQLAYFLARSLTPLSWVHTEEGMEKEGDGPCPQQPEDILACLGSVKLSSHFRAFGKAVGSENPKVPDDIYKQHLEPARTTAAVTSANANLASTFVNAFVNAGFGNDKLMIGATEGNSWIYKNKNEGMKSATASIGMSMLWDSEAGIDHIDKYSYSSEEHIKAGALLAMGILHSSIRTDPDVAFALLEEHVDSMSTELKVAAINGIAMAYAGSQRRDILEKLLPHVADETNSMEVAAMAALGLGFVFVGSGDGEIASAVLQTLMEREPAQLESEWTVFMGLALGLIFLCEFTGTSDCLKPKLTLRATQDASDATIETLRAIDHPMAETAVCLVDVCSYAGTGNVLKIQDMLHICGEHADSQKKVAKEPEAAAAPAPETSEDVNMFESAEAARAAPGADATGAPSMAATSPAGFDAILQNMMNPRAPTSNDAAPAPEGAAPAAPAAAEGEADAPAAEEEEEEAEEGEPKPLRHQAVATLGIALIAMGEDIGSEMALRQFQHLVSCSIRGDVNEQKLTLQMTYGDQPIRASVPLALALLSASNPQLSILDTLSKYSHDSDLQVAQNAILAMGIVGAGTNNARLAQMLRALSSYYHKEAETLFMVRIAQVS